MMNFRLWAKFCIKCFLVLLPFWVVWGYIGAFPLNYMDEENAFFAWNKRIVHMQSLNTYDVLILGDSLNSAAYEPEYMSERVLNLALINATPMDMYYTLCDYLETHPAPKVCYISFHPIHLTQPGGLFIRTFYSHMRTLQQEWEILRQAEAYHEETILLPTAYKDWLSCRLCLPNKYLPALCNAAFNNRKISNETVVHLGSVHRGTFYSRTVREFNHNLDNRSPSLYKPKPFFDDYFRKIFQKCETSRITVRIVMTPFLSDTKNTYNHQDLCDYYKSFHIEKPDMISFYEMENGFTSIHFQDTNHLNMHGALKFTKAIKRLYPEDFANAANDPVSRNTIDGMTDYLQMENYPGEILRRVEDTDFSAVIIRWPGKGGHDEDVLAAVDEYYPSMRERAEPLAEKGGTEAAVFFVNGMAKESIVKQNGNDFSLSDNRTQEPLRLHIENNAKATLHLPWQADPLKIAPKLAMDMTVVILNHYDNSIVAVKHFAFSHGSYQLIPEK